MNELLKDYAMKFVGIKYNWGGDDPMGGFDCSGYVCELLKAFGLISEHEDFTAKGLYDRYKDHKIVAPEHGALVFFGKNADQITHVGFCLNKHQMIEAGGGGSKTISEEVAIKQNAYIKLRPILKRRDIVGYVLPPWTKGE